jgi:hypothetical protein
MSAHLSIHPAVNELLQARLPAQVLGRGVVRGHVLPRINLEHLPRGSILMRAVRFRPGQPPVVDAAFLFPTDVAIEGLGPGHSFTSLDNILIQKRQIGKRLANTRIAISPNAQSSSHQPRHWSLVIARNCLNLQEIS